MLQDLPQNLRQAIDQRAAALAQQYQFETCKQTDHLFAMLLALQWIAGIGIATWISPRAWEGMESYIHPHIWAAVFLGGVIACYPIVLAITHPGAAITRYVIAVAQMLHSALLIHLSGGRIESHFHIFGSLAFLSFYRDWRVLVPATIVVALSHALRGIFWPESIFGVVNVEPWRWVEHVGWVVFEDIFLFWACLRGAREVASLALRQAELEAVNARVEAEVKRQTERLEAATQEMVTLARRGGMAEIATGVLHNVGNVLNSVNISASVALRMLKQSEVASLVKAGEMLRDHTDDLPAYLTVDERGKQLPHFLVELADCLGKEQNTLVGELEVMEKGLEHIKQIVSAQQQHAKSKTLRQRVDPAELFELAITMDQNSARQSEVKIIREFAVVPAAVLDKHRVLQILINLLSNARRSIQQSGRPDQRIVARLAIARLHDGDRVQFAIRDNGIGIAPENLVRIFSHGFTTGRDGHGFGLHSAVNDAKEMGGDLSTASEGAGHGATFTLELPLGDRLSQNERILSREEGRTCPAL